MKPAGYTNHAYPPLHTALARPGSEPNGSTDLDWTLGPLIELRSNVPCGIFLLVTYAAT